MNWHERVKKALKEIGESRDYDVSESEQEMHLTKRVSLYVGEGQELHTLTHKPDVVWKKAGKYHVIFQIEYLKGTQQIPQKSKYALGNLLLAFMSLKEKSCNRLIFLTNNEDLCEEVGKFVKFSQDWIQNFDKVRYQIVEATTYKDIKKELQTVDV